MSQPSENDRERLRLYLVGISHLDTQWRWTVRDVIRRFLPRTLKENFSLFKAFPDYVLSFEGAFRYMLAEEYYPEEFKQLKRWVAAGRWRIAGSMLDAPDVNLASAESLIRHVLYATRYFRRTFGKSSIDIFLPDCFGFPFSLPTIAAHCGLAGFSSQKFGMWMAPATIPFELGLWEGPDGARIPAALKPGGYGERLTQDLSRSRSWQRRLLGMKERGEVPIGLKYFGVGDRGGSPDEASLFWASRSLGGGETIQVVHSGSDQLFRDLTDEERDRLPVHRGELLLPTHGTGCWTSQAVLKRWNRKNELLADAAERAAVLASWLAQFPYPATQLRDAWIRFLWHQMHDDLTGTSIPEAYEITWNDEAIAANRFATVLTDSVSALTRGLDTNVEGIPLVVFNPLAVERKEAVSARVDLDARELASVRVFDPEGIETPSQVVGRTDGTLDIVFVADLPPLGFSVYDVRPTETPCDLATGLSIGEDHLENERFRVEIDHRGDISRILDKRLEREILRGGARLELVPDRSPRWPAWEIRHEAVRAEPILSTGPVQREIVEAGPARVAMRIRRRFLGSTIVQTVHLSSAGDGHLIALDNDVDWRTRGHLLKARFSLMAESDSATYDLGCGVVERGNNTRSKYEVPGHQWADLTDQSGSWGVSILNDCKYGWDKPDDRTLRLSLLRSPHTGRKFPHQATQDFGRHRFSYALLPHQGSWGDADTALHATRFNQPPMVFQADPHGGPLGRRRGLIELDTPSVTVRALKRSEGGTEVVLRLQETSGRELRTTVHLGIGIGSAREIDGCEREIGRAQVEDRSLHTRLRPFEPKSFALRLTPPRTRIAPLQTARLDLEHDTVALSFHTQKRGCDLDGRGHSLPGELYPAEIMSGEIPFRLAPAVADAPHCTSCHGQALRLSEVGHDRLFLLAAVTGDRDREVEIRVDDQRVPLTIHSWSRPLAQWRRHRYVFGRLWGEPEPGYLNTTPLAWLASHRHDRRVQDQPYVFCYLFRYSIPLPAGASRLVLPDIPSVKLFAATGASTGGHHLVPAHDLVS